MIKIQRRHELSEESRQIIKSSYSDLEFQLINTKLVDVKSFLIATINAKEVGVVAIKEELKEKPYLYIQCLAVLPGEFWDDVIMSLVQGAKAYATELGFHEVHIGHIDDHPHIPQNFLVVVRASHKPNNIKKMPRPQSRSANCNPPPIIWE